MKTYTRPTDFGLHGEYLQNYIDETDPNTVLLGELEIAVSLAKTIREQIVTAHLLAFGSNIIDVLEVAMWEWDYVVALKYFNAIPPSARNASINLVITGLQSAAGSSFSVFQYAAKFGIRSHDDLVKIFDDLVWRRSDLGLHFHHLVEQRFKDIPGVKQWLGARTNQWDCIVLKATPEHSNFTGAWRTQIGYVGDNVPITTANATITNIEDAARIIYANYPEILLKLGL